MSTKGFLVISAVSVGFVLWLHEVLRNNERIRIAAEQERRERERIRQAEEHVRREHEREQVQQVRMEHEQVQVRRERERIRQAEEQVRMEHEREQVRREHERRIRSLLSDRIDCYVRTRRRFDSRNPLDFRCSIGSISQDDDVIE